MVRRGRFDTVLALTAIFGAALNLRIGVTEVGPLIDRIRADTGMSAAVAGLLGSVPFVCMGVFAPLGMRLVLRVAPRLLVAGCMLLIIAGTLARAVAPSPWLVVTATIPLGVGLAVAGVVLPGVIKSRFPERTGAAMGGYVAVLSIGASATALTMVPLADSLHSWRDVFAASAIPTLLCLPLWLLLPSARTGAGSEPANTRPLTIGTPSADAPRQSPTVIALLAAVFGLQSVCFAAITNWVASLYHHHGWSAGAAGFTTALASILVIPGALIIPALSDRGDRHNWLLASALLMASGMFGFAFAPTAAPWLWILAFGMGNGALFPLALTLPQDLADDEHGRTVLTTWMLGFGYLLSGAGPLIVGGMLELTGSFVAPMALLGVMGALSGVVALSPALRRPTAAAVLAA